MPTSPDPTTFLLIHGGASTARFWVEVYFQPVYWSTVTAPITYVRAERDTAVPVALQDEMITNLPGTPDVRSWDCGHILPVTRPDEFAALLREVSD